MDGMDYLRKLGDSQFNQTLLMSEDDMIGPIPVLTDKTTKIVVSKKTVSKGNPWQRRIEERKLVIPSLVLPQQGNERTSLSPVEKSFEPAFPESFPTAPTSTCTIPNKNITSKGRAPPRKSKAPPALSPAVRNVTGTSTSSTFPSSTPVNPPESSMPSGKRKIRQPQLQSQSQKQKQPQKQPQPPKTNKQSTQKPKQTRRPPTVNKVQTKREEQQSHPSLPHLSPLPQATVRTGKEFVPRHIQISRPTKQ